MNSTDETVLTRFASGDMTIAEETEFLAGCEIQPEGWRAAALALVEQRQFVSALREFADDRNAPSINGPRRRTNFSRVRGPIGAMIAASLTAVLLGGLPVAYWLGQQRGNDVQQVHRDLPEGVSGEGDPSFVVYVQPPSGVDFGGAAQTPSESVSLPAAITAGLENMNARPVLSEEALSLLRQAGVEVDDEPALHVFEGNDGERWAVPARKLELRYVNHQN